MNARNYQKELDRLIDIQTQTKTVPTLLLHSCCAPCSSYVLEYLSNYFKITIYYYNPNIYPPKEYDDRVLEQENLLRQMTFLNPVEMLTGDYDPREFYEVIKGLEKEPEGGERCYKCYELRLIQAARVASLKGYDYFTTTLSISPMKNAAWLNEIGERVGKDFQVKYLPSDFKKKNGYKRSIELSAEYDLYRQSYCGCIFSLKERLL